MTNHRALPPLQRDVAQIRVRYQQSSGADFWMTYERLEEGLRTQIEVIRRELGEHNVSFEGSCFDMRPYNGKFIKLGSLFTPNPEDPAVHDSFFDILYSELGCPLSPKRTKLEYDLNLSIQLGISEFRNIAYPSIEVLGTDDAVADLYTRFLLLDIAKAKDIDPEKFNIKFRRRTPQGNIKHEPSIPLSITSY